MQKAIFIHLLFCQEKYFKNRTYFLKSVRMSKEHFLLSVCIFGLNVVPRTCNAVFSMDFNALYYAFKNLFASRTKPRECRLLAFRTLTVLRHNLTCGRRLWTSCVSNILHQLWHLIRVKNTSDRNCPKFSWYNLVSVILINHFCFIGEQYAAQVEWSV